MKRRENFVCGECGNADVRPLDQFSEAIEYRRMDMKERLHRRTLRLVCRACVMEKKNEGRGEQGSLLDGGDEPPSVFASEGR